MITSSSIYSCSAGISFLLNDKHYMSIQMNNRYYSAYFYNISIIITISITVLWCLFLWLFLLIMWHLK